MLLQMVSSMRSSLYLPIILLMGILIFWAIYRIRLAIQENRKNDVRSILLWSGVGLLIIGLLGYGAKILFLGN